MSEASSEVPGIESSDIASNNVVEFVPREKTSAETTGASYAELAAATNFSFLRGASTGQDMVLTSLLHGYTGLGVADRNTLAGVVRAWLELQQIRKDGLPTQTKVRDGGSPGEHGWAEHPDEQKLEAIKDDLKKQAKTFKLIIGARLSFIDGTPDIIAYPKNKEGWARLCRILTKGNLRAAPGKARAVKGECRLTLDDLCLISDLMFIVVPGKDLDGLGWLLDHLGQRALVWLGAVMHRQGGDERRLHKLKEIAASASTPLIAINDVLYHEPEQRDLQDVMTCIRAGLKIEEAGKLLEANAERHLKKPQEMARLFARAPEAVAQTQVFLDLIEFDLGELAYIYPDEPVPPGWTGDDYLKDRAWFYAGMKYDWRIPKKVKRLIRKELAFIRKRKMSTYFLTIFDMVRVAEDMGILCQGRGSAANSAVCFVLGITSVNPASFDVLFERFLSAKRMNAANIHEPPDIDVDFEHERREDVIQHMYTRYGRERAAIAATVIHYRPRSAMREVGKVLGLTDDVTARLSGLVWGSWGEALRRTQLQQAGLDPDNPVLHRALEFAGRLQGYPRHLSQHVGGFVLTRGRLDELTPIGNAAMDDRTFIEWDKDDIDTLGLMKVDVLALGMLTCIRKARNLVHKHGGKRYGLRDFPREDPTVYEMLWKADSLGVFQVESRAQMSMLPRLRPKEFYDLVIEVAIVRPGPIQGNMVHPYLKRRAGEEKITYPAPSPEHGKPTELYEILNKTNGVPLFQEQAMRLAMVAAKFTDTEANELRKAMATFRNVGTIGKFEKLMVNRMIARGYDPEFAQNCFEQIKGFGSYGFPESHAAAFAQLVYVSCWLKKHHPAAFAAALLNSQPMGFYAPAQIIRDAQEHGVEVRAVDVNFSAYDHTLERREDGALAVRLGFRLVDGLGEADGEAIVKGRGAGYMSIEDMRERGRISSALLRRLADADAFRSVGQDRREALWAARRLPNDKPLPLFAAAAARELGEDAATSLPDMRLGEHVTTDYQMTRISLKAHPMEILRPVFKAEGVLSCAETSALKNGGWARTAGVILVRQRPGNGKAIFITLEDETGITNVLLWAKVFEKFRAETMASRLLLVEGRVQRSPEGVTHLMGAQLIDRTAELDQLSDDGRAEQELTRADEVKHPQHPRGMHRHPRNVRVLPKSRDFH